VVNPTYAEIATSDLNKKPSAMPPTMAVETTMDSEGYSSCLGTQEDFGDLMNKVWPIVNSHTAAIP
jgi:hypothetical protein